MQTFGAPWGKTLLFISIISTALLVLVALALDRSGPLPRLLLLLPAGALPFVIRGYTIEDGHLGIRRLFWTTRIPLAGLKSAQFRPDAMRMSIRTCGNGGLYSITGWYWNRTLGAYRAWVTDLNRSVVLTFAGGRTLVVSPSDPAAFVAALSPPASAENG